MSVSIASSSSAITGLERDFMIVRALMISPAALFATGFLIWGMERLIYTDPLVVEEAPVYSVPSPVLKEQPVIETRRNEIEKPAKVEEEPPVPPLDKFEMDPGPPLMPGENFVEHVADQHKMTFSTDVPIATMLVQPEYPTRLANRGIEGFVDVKFDVTAMGTAENVKVIFSEPERVFDKAALNAVKRWKFQPAEKNGKPTAYKGMEHRIVFQMSKSV